MIRAQVQCRSDSPCRRDRRGRDDARDPFVHELTAVPTTHPRPAAPRDRVALRRRTGGTDAGLHSALPGARAGRVAAPLRRSGVCRRRVGAEGGRSAGAAGFARWSRSAPPRTERPLLDPDWPSNRAAGRHFVSSAVTPPGRRPAWRDWRSSWSRRPRAAHGADRRLRNAGAARSADREDRPRAGRRGPGEPAAARRGRPPRSSGVRGAIGRLATTTRVRREAGLGAKMRVATGGCAAR